MAKPPLALQSHHGLHVVSMHSSAARTMPYCIAHPRVVDGAPGTAWEESSHLSPRQCRPNIAEWMSSRVARTMPSGSIHSTESGHPGSVSVAPLTPHRQLHRGLPRTWRCLPRASTTSYTLTPRPLVAGPSGNHSGVISLRPQRQWRDRLGL